MFLLALHIVQVEEDPPSTVEADKAHILIREAHNTSKNKAAARSASPPRSRFAGFRKETESMQRNRCASFRQRRQWQRQRTEALSIPVFRWEGGAGLRGRVKVCALRVWGCRGVCRVLRFRVERVRAPGFRSLDRYGAGVSGKRFRVYILLILALNPQPL